MSEPQRIVNPATALLLFHHNMEVDICAFGLRHIHAAIKANGYQVHSLYVGFDPESEDGLDDFRQRVLPELMAALHELAPDLVGISVFSCYVPIIRRVIAKLREQSPQIVIIAGGPDPTLVPERWLSEVDFVFRGECERAIIHFLARLERGEAPECTPNVWCQRGEDIYRNAMLPLEQDLDTIARPDFEDDGRHIYINSKYSQIQGSMQWYSMMASRGCPYKCEFCVNPVQRQVYRGLGRFLRRRSVVSVINELKQVKRRNPKLRKIYFYDEVFTTDVAWLDEFATAYSREITLPFFCQTDPRIDNRRVLPHLARAGVRWLSMGIQGSPAVARKYYDRPYRVEDILLVAQLGKKYGFKSIFDLIIDDPFSTDRDRREVLDLLSRLPRPYVLNTYSLLYFPGYLTTQRALQAGLIDEHQIEGGGAERFNWNRFMQPDKNARILFWECLYDLAANSDYPGEEIRRLAEDAALAEDPGEFVHACLRARRQERLTYVPESEFAAGTHVLGLSQKGYENM